MPLDYLVKLFNTKKNKTNQLKQGSLFLKHKKNYKKGIIEGFSIANANKALEEAGNSPSSIKMEQLQAAFNETLETYSDLYTRYLTQKMENKTTDEYVGKSFEYKNNHYYINENGYVQKYDSDVWNKIAKKNAIGFCPPLDSDLQPNEELFSSFMNNKGSDIKDVNFPCKGFSGKNIKLETTSTTEYAWMDVKGFKRKYPNNNNQIPNNHISCPDDFEKVTLDQWNSIPDGPPMDSSEKCEPSNSNTATATILKKLNDKLVEYATHMKQISDEEMKYTGAISEQEKNYGNEIEKKTNQLLSERAELNKIKRQVNELVTSYDERKKDVGSLTLQNIVWLSALVILLGIIINRVAAIGRR